MVLSDKGVCLNCYVKVGLTAIHRVYPSNVLR